MKIKNYVLTLLRLSLLAVYLVPYFVLQGNAQAAPAMSATFIDSRSMSLTVAGDNFGTLRSSDGALFSGAAPLVQGVVSGNARCGLFLSFFVAPNVNTARVTAARGQAYDSTGAPRLDACPQNVASEFIGATATLNRSNAGTDNPNARIIRANSAIRWEGVGLTPTGLNVVDQTKAPATDTLVLKDSGGRELSRKQASRTLSGDGDIIYSASFTNINPGTYQLCSTVADRCIPAVKKSSEILNITVEAPRGKYDIRSAAAAGGPESPPTCEEQNDIIILGWILCQGLAAIDTSVTQLMKVIDDLLYLNPMTFQTDELKGVWAYFRTIATFLLIVIGLIMVISQAISIGPFDAYTVKRVLPRLVVGIIGIQLSWYLFTALIMLTNGIAHGIEGLMYAPFGGADKFDVKSILGSQANSFFLASGGALVAGGLALGLFGLLSLVVTAFIAALIAFALLAVRQFVLIALLVVAPIGIVAWILPNTEKLWKIFWESFSKLLMMYPMIIFLVAAGRVFAYIASGTNANTQDHWVASAFASPAKLLMLVVGLFGPFFLIPKTFQLAGSAFANIAGISNNRSRGVFDRLKNYRGNRMAENWQNTKGFSRFEGNNKFTRGLNTALGGMSTPRAWGSRQRMAAARESGRTLAGQQFADSNKIFQANKNNDQFLLALANEDLAREKLRNLETSTDFSTNKGKQAEAAGYRQALAQAQLVGGNKNPAAKMAALQALSASGYQFDEGQAGYNQLAETVAGITGTTLERDSAGNVTGATGVRAGDFAAMMNSAQYNLKQASRFDLAGLNYGSGFDLEGGLKKASLYQLANSKPATIKAWGGELADKIGPLTSDEMDRASVQYKELEAMLPNSTGAVRNEVVRQMDNLRDRGVEAHMQQPSGRTDGYGNPIMVTDRVKFNATLAQSDPTYEASFTVDERRQGFRTVTRPETKAEEAQRKARNYERPDPNKM